MLGCLIGLAPMTGILCIIIWVAVLYLTNYASLASIISTCSAVVLTFLFGNQTYSFALLVIAFLVVWSHKKNIERLMNGTESKVNL